MPTDTSTLSGACLWEKDLYQHLLAHEHNEREALLAYQEAAAVSGSKPFRYLVSLIIEDELRHHRVLAELAAALKADTELQRTEPDIPRLDHWGADPAEIVRLTDQLLDLEHDDARELRNLARNVKAVKDTTLWQLLIKLMEMDTAKHIEILEFVRRHARKVD